ncbi:RICIN domain-containing protein [Candidatus Saccharibacteria bacterium]|nr:RICIN domain-containing protein [Candidatus Saccharibacteria bacterium]
MENKKVRRRDKRIWYVVLGVFVAVFLFTFLINAFKNQAEEADAANLSAFDPGYIISDWQMSNYRSMNESQIQSFLYLKNSCNDTNLSRYTAGEKVDYFSEISPPRTWHIKDGHFVCMADEVFDGGTAAHIIYQAAQEYRINPQVLLVLLEKEQSLVRDTFPHSQQYRSATGYGCPDTAACSSKYYGLKNQIENAAALFRTVLDGGWTNYPLGDNYVQYNPNAACGGTIIKIRNLATSALYRYTPYQPNAATLAGGSDGCSAYGNLNFYRYFEDWFGGITNIQENMKIAEGTYYIKSLSAPDIVLDIYGGEMKKGTNVQLYNKNYTDAQKWNITYNSETDDYNIINAYSGMALDVFGASEENGSNIQIWNSNGTCAQRWKIIQTEKDNVEILSTCSLKSIGAEDGIIKNMANVELQTYIDSKAQQWLLEPVDIVDDGIYIIASPIDSNKVIDIKGGSNNAQNGTNIQLWVNNNTAAQRWSIKRDTDGYYTIKNLQSGKSMDVALAGDQNGTNIQAWNSNDTCAQKWRVLVTENGVTFISACSLRVLDLYAANTGSGSNIQLFDANNTKAQRWVLTKVFIVEEGEYQIVSALSDQKALDLFGNYDKNGTNIQLYDANSTSAQKWIIKYDEKTDYYRIINSAIEKSIDVEMAGIKNGTNVQLWANNNTCAQKWLISKVGDYYVFRSACSNLALDVAGGIISNRTNVQLFNYNGSKAQKWLLK